MATIPALSLSEAESELEFTGGTDVKWSPTIDYFRYVILPAYRIIGINCKIELKKRGFYPNGGGKVKINVKPSRKLKSLRLIENETLPSSGISICSKLPYKVAERHMTSAINYLSDKKIIWEHLNVDVDNSESPGSSITLYSVGTQGPFKGADSIGEKGKPAEKVGKQAAEFFLKEFSSSAPIDRHMGDMLVVPLFLAKGESQIRVSNLTSHLSTNLNISRKLTGRNFCVREHNDGTSTININS
jgi:RNA 3'-terminal phosphate cyclase (ATP)